MAEPGLSQRLRRHSRNSGMMIGVSMAAAIIICVAAFIWLYVQIGPLLSDFIPEDTAEDGSDQASVIGAAATPSVTSQAEDEFALDEIEPEPMGTADPTDDTNDDSDSSGSGNDDSVGTDNESEVDEEEQDAWEPTHRIREGPNVNFRSGPNTISQPQGALAPGTPMEFLGDEQPTGGVTWMYFEIQDGTRGWIRDIDVIELDPEDADDTG